MVKVSHLCNTAVGLQRRAILTPLYFLPYVLDKSIAQLKRWDQTWSWISLSLIILLQSKCVLTYALSVFRQKAVWDETWDNLPSGYILHRSSNFKFVHSILKYVDVKEFSLSNWITLKAWPSSQWSIFFSIPHLMLGGIWGHHVNQWVKTSLTTPLPGLCTSGEILPYMTSLSVGKISLDVHRPGSGVVRLVLTHWLT